MSGGDATAASAAQAWYDRHIGAAGSVIDAPIAIWHVPSDTVAANDRWVDLLGRNPSAHRPRHADSWSERFTPIELAVHRAELARLFNREIDVYQCEWRVTRDDGLPCPLAVRQRVVEWDVDGNPVVVSASAADVSEFRLFAAEHQQELLEIAAALSGTGAGLWEIDVTTDTVWLSKEWCALVGIPVIDRMPLADIRKLFHPDDVDRVVFASSIYMAEPVDHFESEFRVRRGDDSWMWVQARYRPFRRGPDGEILSVLGFHIDIDARVRAEHALRTAVKFETVGKLAGGVAHDFNNALGVILGNAELIGLSTDLEIIHQRAETISSTASRASRLTGQLLGLARDHQPSVVVVELNELLLASRDLVAGVLTAGVELDLDLDPDAGAVEVDAGALEDALLNLVLNSRDASATTISLRTERIDDEVDLVVADNGVGMARETLEQATEPFFTTKDIGAGTGLGLSMVKRTVEGIGGVISITSTDGHGTKVSMRLPRRPSGDVAEAAPKPTANGRDLTVLVVDDEDGLREIARTFLERAGCRVVDAADGATALGVLQHRDDIDVVVSDIVMPGGMNGVDLAQRVRDINPKVKVLLTTGYADNAPAHEHVLAKPYREDELVRWIVRLGEIDD